MYEQFILNLTGANGWMPHGFCIQWTPSILWSYVIADALTALSYYAIPLVLAYIAWRRKDLQFRRIYLMFCAFILACGTSHLFSIVLLWQPLYWLDAVIKVITAGLSVATAAYLINLIPLALQQNTSVELENKLLHSLVKQSATELTKLNARFYATFENAPIGIINLSPGGGFLEVNQRFSDLINYRKEELITLTLEEIMPQADYATVAGKIAECLAGEISEFTVENKYLRQDGKQFWGSTSIKLIRYKEGSPKYFMAIIEDISQRKVAEAILQERDKINFALNNTPILIGYWDNQLKNLFSNPAYTRWFDKTPEQIKGQHVRQVLGKQLYAENLPHINAVMHGEPQKFNRHILCQQTGEKIHTQVSYLPHIVKQEVQGFYVLGIDITDQERLDDANYYNLTLLNNLTQGVILTDINKQITYINRAFEELSGYSNEDLLGKSCAILQGEKTDPQEILLMREALSSLQSYQGEMINYRKDGSAFWVELVINPVYDRHDNLIQFIGFQRDISKRKHLEAKLLASEQSFKALADNTPVLIWLAGIDKLCYWFNKTWLNFTGRTMAQESGNGWVEGVHPDDLERCMATYIDHFDQQLPFRMEYRLRRQDGQYRWIDDVGAPHFDSDGVFIGYIGSCTDISGIYEAQAKIKDNQKLLANLFAHVPGMVYQYKTDPNGSFSFPFVSDGIKDIYETTPEQVYENATLLFNSMPPDDLDRINRSIEESTRTLQPWQQEYRVNLPGKGLRWLSGHSQPEKLIDGSILWHGFISDITERKLLDNERDRLLQLIDESQDLISIADMQGQIMFINRAGLKMLGLPEKPNSSRSNIKEFHSERATRRVLEEAIPVACQQGFWEGENTLLHRDGHEIPVSQLILCHHQDATGSPIFLSTIIRDMTKSKQIERELREAKDKAERLAQAKSDFLANMSHEIRTPMTAIIGFSELALTKTSSPEITAYLDKINSASTNLLGILNDILDLSKLEAGSIAIYPAPFTIDSLRDNLYGLFIDTAEKKGLGFTVMVGADVPPDLVGDKLRLEQILINLLGNAVKFTANGSVSLGITLQQVDGSQARLLFCVKDTGIGITADDQNKLFKPFQQLDESITRRFGGTGLGLALSHNLVQMMGGELSVISMPGLGSSFSFELVLAVSPRPDQEKIQPPSVTPDLVVNQVEQPLAGSRILVAEDNIFNQQIIREFLNLSGINVEIANDGQEALALLATSEFDAVLMDIHMPVMDGFEATRQIRSLPQFKALPIIALTAGVTEEERGQCLAAGMNDFASKPINSNQLLLTLAQWLKQAERKVRA